MSFGRLMGVCKGLPVYKDAVKPLRGEQVKDRSLCRFSSILVRGPLSPLHSQSCLKITHGILENIYPQGNVSNCLINSIPIKLHHLLLKVGKQRQRKELPSTPTARPSMDLLSFCLLSFPHLLNNPKRGRKAEGKRTGR